MPRDESHLILISYNMLHHRVDLVEAVGPAVVLADEAHHLCGGGDVAKSFQRIAAEADNVVLATATPNQDLAGLDLTNLVRAGGFPDVPTAEQYEQCVFRDDWGNHQGQ
jgi:hypothetical protein